MHLLVTKAAVCYLKINSLNPMASVGEHKIEFVQVCQSHAQYMRLGALM